MSKSALFSLTAIAAMALAFPFSALSDMTGTVTLSNALNGYSLDAGATPGCTGDIVWAGNYINLWSPAPHVAGIYSIPGAGGVDEFNSLTEAALQNLTYSPPGTGAPATVNGVFAVKTNGGHYAKLLVTAVGTDSYGNINSVTLQYLTYGVNAGTPVVTQVQNNFSYLGVSPGSLFIIVGCGLAAPGSQAVLQDSTKGLPLTLNGASVSVTSGGVTTEAALYYATPTALAAVMPSNMPPGPASVTVTYNSQSNTPEAFTLEWTSFGFASSGFFGSGQVASAIATDANYQLLTPTHSASPGQVITFWGSGLGASTADSDTTYTPTPHGISVAELPLQVLIGGIPAPILYQGRNGYPGLDQVNVTVPPDVPPGCAVSVVAINSNYQIISNSVTLPVAAGGGACIDPIFAIGPTQAASLSGKSSVNVAMLSIQESTVDGIYFGNSGIAEADFLTEGGGALPSDATGNWPPVSLGSCIVGWPANFLPPVPALLWLGYSARLDAGAMTLTGPGGTQPFADIFGAYSQVYGVSLTPGSSAFPATGGSFSIAAPGGKDIGAFSTTLSFPLLENFNGLQASAPIVIGRGGQTVTWTGGANNEFVTISGTNGYTGFACNAPASAGQFTIPPEALVPLATANTTMWPSGSSAAYATFALQVTTYPKPFTASGVDIGYVYGSATQYWSSEVTYY